MHLTQLTSHVISHLTEETTSKSFHSDLRSLNRGHHLLHCASLHVRDDIEHMRHNRVVHSGSSVLFQNTNEFKRVIVESTSDGLEISADGLR